MVQLCQGRTASIVRRLSPRSYSVTVILTFLFPPEILSKSHPVIIAQPFRYLSSLSSHPIHPLCDGPCGKLSKSNNKITWVLTIKNNWSKYIILGKQMENLIMATDLQIISNNILQIFCCTFSFHLLVYVHRFQNSIHNKGTVAFVYETANACANEIKSSLLPWKSQRWSAIMAGEQIENVCSLSRNYQYQLKCASNRNLNRWIELT